MWPGVPGMLPYSPHSVSHQPPSSAVLLHIQIHMYAVGDGILPTQSHTHCTRAHLEFLNHSLLCFHGDGEVLH